MNICGLGSIVEVLIKKIQKLWASNILNFNSAHMMVDGETNPISFLPNFTLAP